MAILPFLPLFDLAKHLLAPPPPIKLEGSTRTWNVRELSPRKIDLFCVSGAWNYFQRGMSRELMMIAGSRREQRPFNLQLEHACGQHTSPLNVRRSRSQCCAALVVRGRLANRVISLSNFTVSHSMGVLALDMHSELLTAKRMN